MGFNTSDGASGVSTSHILANGNASFKGDVSIGDSATLFTTIAAVIAALPEDIRTRFATALSAWESAGTLDLEDPTTLPADNELRKAIIRATTAGKINLNGDTGSITSAGTTNIGPFAIGDATGSGHHLVPDGLYYVQRPGTSPNEPVYSVYKGTDETLVIDCGGKITASTFNLEALPALP